MDPLNEVDDLDLPSIHPYRT